MTGINYGKVVTGGLLAGLVLNVLDFVVYGMLMAEEFQANAVRLSLDPAIGESPAAMTTWIVLDFIYGILLVWTYAAIRPRFGPGAKTAACAALLIWAAVTMMNFGFTMTQLFTWAIFMKTSLFSIVIVIAGTVAGAWAYKE